MVSVKLDPAGGRLPRDEIGRIFFNEVTAVAALLAADLEPYTREPAEDVEIDRPEAKGIMVSQIIREIRGRPR